MPPAENSEVPKSGYNLPPPVNEGGVEADANEPEIQAASPETSLKIKSPKSSGSKTPVADFQLNDFSITQPSSAASSTTTDDNPTVAEDNDLIEKEWVDKAKRIIEQYKEDPKNQSKEITLFKADYLKKRYNKVIKVSE